MSLHPLPIYCVVILMCVGSVRSQPEEENCEWDNGGCDINADCVYYYDQQRCACPVSSRTHYFEDGDYGCATNSDCYGRGSGLTCMCRRGYTAKFSSPNGMVCVNDDCGVNRGGCDANADCRNIRHGVECTCRVNYRGDGHTCTRVNADCRVDNGGCHVFADCRNIRQGVRCTCPVNLPGDGYTCTYIGLKS